jgi:hypothetical protein
MLPVGVGAVGNAEDASVLSDVFEPNAAATATGFLANSGAGHTIDLPLGWEQRVDGATRRVFYLDHNKRGTTWNDPRQEGAAGGAPPAADAAGAASDLEVLSSAILPEQQVSMADFSSAVNRQLRTLLAPASASGGGAGALRASGGADDWLDGGSAEDAARERQLLFAQRAHLATTQRYMSAPPPHPTLAAAWAAHSSRLPPAPHRNRHAPAL